MARKNKWTESDIRALFNRLDEQTGANSKDIPIHVNNRLKTTIARYRYYNNDERTAYDFEFGRYIMNVDDKKALDDTAIHEYAHWLVNTVYKHENTGHCKFFRDTVKELGSDNYKSTCTKFIQDELTYAKLTLDNPELKKQLEKIIDEEVEKMLNNRK